MDVLLKTTGHASLSLFYDKWGKSNADPKAISPPCALDEECRTPFLSEDDSLISVGGEDLTGLWWKQLRCQHCLEPVLCSEKERA